MPAFQINDAEWEGLSGLPMLAREVYFVLRRYMDYRSGTTGGPARRVSYQSIAEELYVEPHQGIKGGSPTINELRRAIQWLERVGLVGRDSSANRGQKQLVFQLLMASWDQSARNKVNSKCTSQVNSDLNSAQPSVDDGFSQQVDSEADRPYLAKVNIPPVSGNTSTLHTRAGKFPMHDDWEPNPETFNACLVRNGLTSHQFEGDLLLEFRSYWIARPDDYANQGQWEHRLAQRLKFDVQRTQNGGLSHEASQRSGKQRTRNAFDVYTNDNW